MMNNHYIYYLVDPSDNKVFYVGKGSKSRMYDHENEVKKDRIPHGNKHLYYKIKQILNENRNITYKKLVENLSLDDANKLEIDEIEKQRKINIKLCNIGVGGEGGDNVSNHPNKDEIIKRFRVLNKRMIEKYVKGIPKSEETKKKMSLIEKTPEWRKKISVSRTGHKNGIPSYMKDPTKRKLWVDKISQNHTDVSGNKNPFFGKPHSDETKKQWSEKRRKRYKVSYDGKEIVMGGGLILENFVKSYNKEHGTNYTVPMLKYKNNSAGWKIELYG